MHPTLCLTCALSQLDLRRHEATHPRLGVVDHISVHPLPAGGVAPEAMHLDAAAALAHMVGSSLGSHPLWIPVYMYGHASATRDVPLDSIRRRLGYFARSGGGEGHQISPAYGGSSHSSAAATASASVDESMLPTYGPPVGHVTAGVACVGALPWVINFNVVLTWKEEQQQRPGLLLAEARHVAAAVSARRGGPAGCQSMALEHQGDGGDGAAQEEVEVACNILTPAGPAVERVRELVAAAAGLRGLRIVSDYCTNLEPAQLRQLALDGDRRRMRCT